MYLCQYVCLCMYVCAHCLSECVLCVLAYVSMSSAYTHLYMSVYVCSMCLYPCMHTVQLTQCNVSPCREVVSELQAKIGTKIFEAALSGKILESDSFLDNEDRVKFKRCIFASQVCTYMHL